MLESIIITAAMIALALFGFAAPFVVDRKWWPRRRKTMRFVLVLRFVPVLMVLGMLFSLGAEEQSPAQVPAPATAQVSDADREGITRAALDYAESYYEGDGAKMERALHPDLAKRIVRNSPEGRSRLDHMSAMTLVQIIRLGSGKNTPPDKQLKDVKILDVYGNNASVRVEMLDWVDYMHVAKWNGQWKIVNVLWEMKPKK